MIGISTHARFYYIAYVCSLYTFAQPKLCSKCCSSRGICMLVHYLLERVRVWSPRTHGMGSAFVVAEAADTQQTTCTMNSVSPMYDLRPCSSGNVVKQVKEVKIKCWGKYATSTTKTTPLTYLTYIMLSHDFLNKRSCHVALVKPKLRGSLSRSETAHSADASQSAEAPNKECFSSEKVYMMSVLCAG